MNNYSASTGSRCGGTINNLPELELDLAPELALELILIITRLLNQRLINLQKQSGSNISSIKP
jgi:hypothetical protein